MHFLNIISTQPIWATRIPLYMEAELRIHGPWGIHEYLGFPPDFLDCHLLSASFHYPFSSPLRNSSWRARSSANPMVSSQVQRRNTWYDPSHHLSAQLWKKKCDKDEAISAKLFWRQDPQTCSLSPWLQTHGTVLSSIPPRLTHCPSVSPFHWQYELLFYSR